MYKKNKATKNNSLKKASISAAVAALASVAAFSGSGTFDSNNVTFGAGRYRGTSRRRWLGNLGGLGDLRGFRYNMKDSLFPTDEDQKENFSYVEKVYDLAAAAMSKHLNPQAIYGYLSQSGLSPGTVPYDRILEYFLREKNYDSGKIILEPRNGMMDPASLGQEFIRSTDRLIKWRNWLIGVFAQFAAIFRLGMYTTKDEGKLEQLKKLAQSGLNAPAELVDAACVKDILRDNSLLEQASVIAETGIKLLFSGKAFSDKGEGTSNEPDGAWEDWKRSDAKGDQRATTDRIPKELRGFRAVLSAILACVKSVDDYAREAYAAVTAYGLRRSLVGMAVRPEDESIVFAAGPKEALASMAAAVGQPGVFVAPLFAASDIVNKINFSGKDAVKTSQANFNSYLSRACRGEKVSFKDLVDVCHRQASLDAAKNPGDLGLSYDLAEVFKGVAGDNAKNFFSWIEEGRKDVLTTPVNYEALKEKAEARPQEIKDMLAEGRKAFDRNDGSEASRAVHFVDALGNPLPFSVDFNFKYGEGVDKDIPSGTRELFYSLASMPEMLKDSVILEVLKAPFAKLNTGSNSLEYSIESLFNDYDYLFSARESAGKIDEAFGVVNSTLKKMAEIKKTKVSDEEKKKRAEAKTGSAITALLALDAGNVNTDRYKVTPDGKTLVIENLEADCKFISPVFCPKNSTDKAGNVNKDLPIVEVNNGKAVVNMSDVLTGPGRFELHIRKAVKDEGGAIKDYQFLFKLNAVYDADKIKGSKLLEPEKREQSNSSFLDLSSTRIKQSTDGVVKISVELKEGYSASDAPKEITVALFKQGVPPNMEHDKYAAHRNGRRFDFTSLPKLEGSYQCHFYNGEIKAENYLGKVEFNTSKLADAASNVEASTIGDALSKVDREDKDDAVISRVLEVVVPDESFEDNRPGEVSYTIIDDNGKPIRRGSTKLKFVKTKDDDRSVFKGTFEFSGAKKSQKIEIDADDGLVLKSEKTVGADTEIGEVVPFTEKEDRMRWYD